MKSIRLYLLLALLATITLVNFVSLLHGYQSSMHKAQTLFDSRLESTAILIASANSRQLGKATVTNQQTPYTFFQIIDDKGALLTRSENAPDSVLSDLDEGFQNTNFGSYRWRNYVYRDKVLQRWIVVAERIDIRYMLAEDVVMESLLPIVMAIPVAALIIWFAVGIGLKPLNTFASQLSERRADDLRPIELERVPKELTTVVNNTNSLLLRLAEAFDREQRLSAAAAHELRTPVSVLTVHLQNLRQRLGTYHEYILSSRDGVARMGPLSQHTLTLYRPSHAPTAVNIDRWDTYKSDIAPRHTGPRDLTPIHTDRCQRREAWDDGWSR